MWRSSTRFTVVALLLASGIAVAERPPEVVRQERQALDAEIEQLKKKTDALGHSLDERRTVARKRLRTLYKLSHGGYLALLLGAESSSDFYARRNGVGRVLARDLAEVHSLGSELADLARDRERLRDRERRAFELDGAPSSPTAGSFPARVGGLLRPVAGAVVGRFGPGHDPKSDLDFTRDGVLLRAATGEPVRSVAAGTVRAIDTLPGLGLSVVLDHGGGWVSVLGRLATVRVQSGQFLAPGAAVGGAAGPSVELQLVQSGTWVDPAPWLAPSANK